MRFIRMVAWGICATGLFLPRQSVVAQVVINELVEDQQDFETTDVPDTREFIELYNAGNSAVDLTNWTIGLWDLDTGTYGPIDTLPSGSMIAPQGYFVMGAASVPNVNYVPFDGELWDNTNNIFELRNPSGTLIDALGVDTFRGTELANATQDQVDQIGAGETAGPAARGGWWGQVESNDAHPSDPNYPNLPLSLGRYRDGRDTNVNGRDFGLIPATPGASNDLPTVAVHDVTNVDSLANGSVLRDDFYASFKLPRVITPGTVDTYNPNAIPASPQSGKAVIAWDETGGGNAVYSKEYTNKFEISAFIDPRPFNNTTTDSTQSEATIYGIGTTDPLFATPNSADLLTGHLGSGGDITSSANGSTGLGWLIQRRTANTGGTQESAAVLQLIDMNDGGDGVPADNDWQVKATIDLTGLSEGWHRLSLEYDPTTGDVTAFYDNQQFDFTTFADLVGNFYIGYRENLPGNGSPAARPPTFDLYVAAGGVPGDYNDNGVVDAADYVLWRNGGPLQNEVSTVGSVTAEDYTAWRARFGNTSGSGSVQTGAAVPEPGTFLLLLASAAVAVAVRRR